MSHPSFDAYIHRAEGLLDRAAQSHLIGFTASARHTAEKARAFAITPDDHDAIERVITKCGVVALSIHQGA